MVNVIKARQGLTRRNFLKTSALVAGTLALSSSIGCKSVDTSGTTGLQMTDEQIFNGACRPNCFGSCQLNVHVREGKVVKTSMAPFEDPAYNRICLRGLSHVGNIYDPDRVKYPMKRTGERGADQWERISWDDAIAEITEKFSSYQREFGPQSVAKYVVSGNYGAVGGSYYTTFFNAISASTISPCVDMGNAIGLNRVVGWAGIWLGSEAKDLVNAKNIFVWGNNITDAQIQEWHFVADAQEAGAKLIVIDPVFTQLAAKADMFVPIRPASDTALTLAMTNVIIKENLINEEFMAEHTVASFLVRDDTGEFLRMSDLGVTPIKGPEDPATGEATEIDPVVVWDAIANAATALEEATAPALEGEYTAGDFACHTAYTLLKQEVMKYPPEVATTLTDVPVDTIIELAHLAVDGPVTHRVGWGPQAYDNGVHPTHAGAAMTALTGQIGSSGAIYGCSDWNSYPGFNSAITVVADAAPSPSIAVLLLPEVMKTGKFKGEDFVLKALFIYNGNPLNTAVNTNAMLDEVFTKVEFIVTVDSMFTDTARYSDIVLPCAQFFEYEDVVGAGPCSHVILSDKAIDPPFEAKADTEIARLLAEKMGLELFPETDTEWLRQYIDTEAGAAMGVSYDTLKEKHSIRWLPTDPYVRWADLKFLTPSGRMEFYVEKPTAFMDQGQAIDVARERLPHFFPPAEAWPENPLYEKYPFVLMSERPRFRVHSQWYNNKFLRELDPVPTVKINPADAEPKGIKNGDLVECFNDRGHAVATASLNDAVRPGTLVYPKSWQISQHVAGGWSELSSSSFDPVMVNQSFMDELCDIRIWEGAGN